MEGIILCGESGPRYAATWTDEAVDIGRLETVGKEIPDRFHLDTEEQRRETESQYEETQMGEEQEETKDQTGAGAASEVSGVGNAENSREASGNAAGNGRSGRSDARI